MSRLRAAAFDWWSNGGRLPMVLIGLVAVTGVGLTISPVVAALGPYQMAAALIPIGLFVRAGRTLPRGDPARLAAWLAAASMAIGFLLLGSYLLVIRFLGIEPSRNLNTAVGVLVITGSQGAIVGSVLLWPRSKTAKLKTPYLAVDLAVIVVAALLFYWYLRVSPSAAPGGSSARELASIITPIVALVGVSVGVLRAPRADTTMGFILVVLVAMLVFVANFGLVMFNTERAGDGLIVALATAILVTGCVAAEALRMRWGSPFRQSTVEGRNPVPWVAVLGIGVFVFKIGVDQINTGVGPIVIGAVVTMLLLIVRQAITMRENAELLAERAALAADTRIAALVRHTSDGIVIADEHLCIRYASPSAEILWGRSGPDLIGVEVRDLFEGHSQTAVDQLLAERLERPGQTDSARWEILGHDGTSRRVEVVAISLLHEPSVAGVIITLRDQTERIQLEEQLYQAQKMEAIGQLAGGVAHDFNNLLTTILGHAEVGIDLVPEDHPVREDLVQIKRASDMAAAMTGQLLAFSRKQVVEPRVVEVRETLDRIIKILRRLITEHVRTSLEIDDDLGQIRVDPGRLNQVIINLAVNARDAMPNGGTLSIRARMTTVKAKIPSAVLPPPYGECVVIDFADTGTGMDAATLSRIFEPFFTTKPTGRGTGLGLATVYGILKQNGAGLVVKSALGQGSTFSVYFPVARGLAEVDAPSAPGQLPGPRFAATILLVEDEPSLREIAQKVLGREGFRVLVAGGAEEAETISASANFPIDLLLTDVVMPGIDGAELARKLRAVRPDLRVLYMSGYPGEDLAGALQLHERFLRKPFTPFVLLENVRAALVGLGGSSTRSQKPPQPN